MRLREDYPQPRDPAHGEASVKILAAGINPVDYKAPKFLVGPIVGLDFCGIIEVAGEGSPFKEGDRVFGTTRGSLAEKALCKCSSMAIAPADLSHEMSAAMPTAYVTSLQALRDHGKLRPGGSVLIIGASGGCGLAGVQIARALGAAKIVGVCSGKNREIVLEHGATDVIDYNEKNF